MTIATYGNPVSLLDLKTEFNFNAANTDVAFNGYYPGKGFVAANTIGYPNGGGPTGAGFVYVPGSGAIRFSDFCASANLTVQTYDLQFGSQTINTPVTGTWTIPRLIIGDITITVIGGGGAGAGGPSSASGGGGGGGVLRVIPGSALLSLGLPGTSISYHAGNRGYDASGGAPGGSFVNPGASFFGTVGQEWYINGPGGQNANNGYNPGGGPGGVGTGTTPTYGTISLGTGGHGNSGAAVTQGGGGGGANGGGAFGGGAGFGGRGGPGANGGDVRNNATYMGVWPGGGGGASDSTGWYIGAFGAGGAVRIQGTWAY